MGTPVSHPADTRDLRRYLRDLVALPAVWGGSDRGRMAEGLADVLAKVLPPDLVRVRLLGPPGQAPAEAARPDRGPDALSEALALWLNGAATEAAVVPLAPGLADGALRAAITPIGYR